MAQICFDQHPAKIWQRLCRFFPLAVQLGATASCTEFSVTQPASKSQVARTSCACGGAAQREGRDRSQTLQTGGDVEKKKEEEKTADGPVRRVCACAGSAPYLCH